MCRVGMHDFFCSVVSVFNFFGKNGANYANSTKKMHDSRN